MNIGGALMDDPNNWTVTALPSRGCMQQHGNVYGEPGYTVRIDPPRASLSQLGRSDRFFVASSPQGGLDIRDRHAEVNMRITGYFDKGIEPEDYAAEICKRLNRSCERASFDTRRWLVYGPAIAALVAWWVLW